MEKNCYILHGKFWWINKVIVSKLGHHKEHGCGLVTKSCPTLVTPGTVAHQASLSRGLSRQENWSGLLCPSPGDILGPGIKLGSPALQPYTLPTEPPGNSCIDYVCAQLHHLCPALCNTMDRSFPASLSMGSSKERTLEWVHMPSSRGSSWPRDRTCDISFIFCFTGGFFTIEPPWKSI